MKFEVFQDKKKQWRFRLKARNGKIICQSEGYTKKGNCLKAIAAIQSDAFWADVVEK